jgi:hypothetical protein
MTDKFKYSRKYEKCEHVEQDVIATGCIHCHVAWCHKRIEILEDEIQGMHEDNAGIDI